MWICWRYHRFLKCEEICDKLYVDIIISKEGKIMKCPSCGNNNPDDAVKCECGYGLTPHPTTLYKSFADMKAKKLFFNSLRAYGRALSTFLFLTAIYTAVALGSLLTQGETPATAGTVVGTAVHLLAQIVTYLALIVAAHKITDEKDIGILESYSRSFSLFPRFIWTSLLYILIVVGGLILFVIPGIIWGLRYVLAPYAVIVEGISGKEALSRSRVLTKDRLLPIGACETIFFWAFFLIIMIPLYVLIFLIGAVTGVSDPNPNWTETISSFGNIISQGLYVIFNVILFKSLRVELPSREIIIKAEAEKRESRRKILQEIKDPCPYCKFNLKSGQDTCDECGKVFYEPAEEM